MAVDSNGFGQQTQAPANTQQWDPITGKARPGMGYSAPALGKAHINTPAPSFRSQIGIGSRFNSNPYQGANIGALMHPSALGGTGVSPGQFSGPNAVMANQGGPSLEQIQAEMARRNVGAQLGPRNAALAGYMMGQ